MLASVYTKVYPRLKITLYELDFGENNKKTYVICIFCFSYWSWIDEIV